MKSDLGVAASGAQLAERFVPSPMLAKSIQAPSCAVPLRQLLKVRGVYNVREAPESVAKAMVSQSHCSPSYAVFKLIGENSIQIRRKLNAQLARELAAGVRDAAFAETCDLHDCPRADDIESMIQSFPALDTVDWDAPAVASGLDTGLWRAWHARHCHVCSPLITADSCYFKLVYHFLRTGFARLRRPG